MAPQGISFITTHIPPSFRELFLKFNFDKTLTFHTVFNNRSHFVVSLFMESILCFMNTSIYSWLFSWRSHRRFGFCGYYISWETQCEHILSCYRVLTRGEYLDEVPWWGTRATELLSMCDIHLSRLWCSWVSFFLETNGIKWWNN